MKENTIKKSTENNTLSIVDEINSKDKITSSNILNNIENVPIKNINAINTMENAEEYYSLNYPEYKLFKIKGVLFCKIGNLLTFNFDKNNNFAPKMSIGPHWFMTLFLNLLILSLGYVLYIFVVKILNIWLSFGYFFLIIIVIFLLDRTALLNAEIAMNKSMDKDNYLYCDRCKIYYNPKDKVQHCSSCKVCIKKLDHHCVWVGKCVGKNNIRSFFGMVIAVAFFYIYIIACVVIYTLKSK
jgi:hypothetical protein